jgi:hypothetical protein
MMDFAELDAIAEDYWQPGGQLSLAFGVVRDGELVHSGGFGQRFLGGPAPMWADRQQGLPLDDFSALLSGGVSLPGRRTPSSSTPASGTRSWAGSSRPPRAWRIRSSSGSGC